MKQFWWLQCTSIGIALFRGFVLECLWNWFVVPAANVPHISYWPMVGVSLFVGLLTEQNDPTTAKIAEFTLEAIDFCVSEERMDDYKLWVAQKKEGATGALWLQILARFGVLAEVLAGGWAIHAALSSP